MVEYTLLILSIKYFTLFPPVSHKKNMSSMYLHHKYGLNSDSFIISSASFAINKMLNRGANLVPITVPPFLLKCFFPNVSMLFFNDPQSSTKKVLLLF